jgi:hypothetical protein
MIEAIKLVGSIVGLLTGIFTVYDRYVRGRPIASLSFGTEGTRKYARIRIGNGGAHEMVVLSVKCSPDVYRLSSDMETRNVIQAAMGREQFFTLKPSESSELFLVSRVVNGLALEVKPQRVTFSISWRRGNSTWLPQIPVFVRTDTQTIRKFGLEQPEDLG